ncbi:hypothetical protein [Desulfofundulus sp.]|uniref:hypothetical protein n=1 Tax=Desulfofundulus sp. TaxID=2282750 RepID=UPI003C780FB5
MLVLLVAIMAGCGNFSTTGSSAPASGAGVLRGNNNTVQSSGRKIWNAPTAKLFGTLRRVEELARDNNYPLTAEQAKKILPIVKDIAAQKNITTGYAAEKQKEIMAVLSPEQQKLISTPPQRPARPGDGKGNASHQRPNVNNGKGDQANFQKRLLERVISVLQQKAGS